MWWAGGGRVEDRVGMKGGEGGGVGGVVGGGGGGGFFFFFFFFKQKTAYEMCGRDWSSDVCSPIYNKLACISSMIIFGDLFQCSNYHSRVLKQLFLREIGRASCRERV